MKRGMVEDTMGYDKRTVNLVPQPSSVPTLPVGSPVTTIPVDTINQSSLPSRASS